VQESRHGDAAGLLDSGAVPGGPGTGWCRAWTDQVDAALARFLADAEARDEVGGGVAVVALGSYARHELCPGSDVDLLLLHDGWATRDLEALVRSLCYPLWDVGLTVGHAVRTPKETVRAAGERIDTATALTDRRLVAGQRGLLDDLAGRMGQWLARNRSTVLTGIAAADAQRQRSAGRHPGMLEPDLKDGAGGLRDLHSLRWAAACLLGEAGLDPLVSAGYIGAVERRELAAAGEQLLATRCALHLVHLAALPTGRRRPGAHLDRLRLDLHDDVAARLGLPRDSGADDLLRTVGLAGRTIAYLHDRTWPLLSADGRHGRHARHGRDARHARNARDARDGADARRPPRPAPGTGTTPDPGDGVSVVDGVLEVDSGRRLSDEPSLGLRALAAGAARGARLGRHTAERWRRELEEAGSLPWDAASRTALLALLRLGPGGTDALLDADHVGLLVAHLPDWRHLRGRPQRNPLHRYDLDTHARQAVASLQSVALGDVEQAHRELWAGLDSEDQELLLLATLLHDVGKAWPGDHSKVGATIARDWMLRMGFGHRRADAVGRLVRLHLLLPETATRRDLDDDDELAAVAGQVAGVVVLDQLYLLSLADSRATGPAAHSPWKDALMATLHGRVRAILIGAPEDGGHGDPADRGDRAGRAGRAGRGDRGDRHAEETLAQALRLAPAAGVPSEDVELLLDGLPRRYLRAVDADQVLEHARLLRPLPPAGTLRARIRPGPAAGTRTITVLAADRLGLMADCAGVLAGHGMAVLDARAFTRPALQHPGVALDWFVVRPDAQADWAAVSEDLRKAAAGLAEPGELVRRWESRRDVRVPALAAAVPVDIAFAFRGVATRIEVRGPDAPGALYRLARVLAEERLDVVGARAASTGLEVNDVFFVRPAGGPLDTDRLSERLRQAASLPAHLAPR